jgi:predicted secreted protein
MRILVGHKCTLKIGTLTGAELNQMAGSGTQTLREIKGVRVGNSGTKSDSTTRTNRGYKRNTQGLKEYDLSFPMLHSDVAADIAAMDELALYYNNGTVFAVRLLDDNSKVYFEGPVICTEFPRDEDLDAPVSSGITLAGAGAPYINNYLLTLSPYTSQR